MKIAAEGWFPGGAAVRDIRRLPQFSLILQIAPVLGQEFRDVNRVEFLLGPRGYCQDQYPRKNHPVKMFEQANALNRIFHRAIGWSDKRNLAGLDFQRVLNGAVLFF